MIKEKRELALYRIYLEGYANGIKEMEQVIEDIKAEIEKIPTDYCGGYIGLNKKEVLQIIDKHIKGDSTNDRPVH